MPTTRSSTSLAYGRGLMGLHGRSGSGRRHAVAGLALAALPLGSSAILGTYALNGVDPLLHAWS